MFITDLFVAVHKCATTYHRWLFLDSICIIQIFINNKWHKSISSHESIRKLASASIIKIVATGLRSLSFGFNLLGSIPRSSAAGSFITS